MAARADPIQIPTRSDTPGPVLSPRPDSVKIELSTPAKGESMALWDDEVTRPMAEPVRRADGPDRRVSPDRRKAHLAGSVDDAVRRIQLLLDDEARERPPGSALEAQFTEGRVSGLRQAMQVLRVCGLVR